MTLANSTPWRRKARHQASFRLLLPATARHRADRRRPLAPIVVARHRGRLRHRRRGLPPARQRRPARHLPVRPPDWRLADPDGDNGLLHMANRDAEMLLHRDERLQSPRGKAVRVLLRLFERTAAFRTLHSG